MTTEASADLEIEAHRRGLREVRLRAVFLLVVTLMLVCIPWWLGHPWLLIALAPLGVALPRLVRMILRPELLPDMLAQRALMDAGQRQRSVNGSAAERLLELEEQLDALDVGAPRRWKLPIGGQLAAPLGILSMSMLAVVSMVKGLGAVTTLFPLGIAGLFGLSWWQSARRERRRLEVRASLISERDRLIEGSSSTDHPGVSH